MRSEKASGGSLRRHVALAYVAGNLIALVLVMLVVAFAGYRVGFSTLAQVFRRVLNPMEEVLDLPDDVLRELDDLNAVVDNAGNPTKQRPHYTILVEEDQRVGWKLRPNVSVSAFQLRALNPVNLDPPVIVIPSDAKISERLHAYLERQTRIRYRYTVDSERHRRTVPFVESRESILLVGDSVGFGDGVNDDMTIASWLQQMISNEYRVINAAVGGYSGYQALETAKMNAEQRQHGALIYIACQNDFMDEYGVSYADQARKVLSQFAALKGVFDGNILVVLTPYLEYSLDDVLLKDGWYREMVEETHKLRKALPVICQMLGLQYIDGATLIDADLQGSGSVLSRFALYVDNAHLSPAGNRLFAASIHSRLADMLKRLHSN